MLSADQVDLLARVVDERAQLALFVKGERVAKDLVDMLAHDARAVVEDVHKGFVLAVHVAHEMLGALGQVENGREVNDLGKRGLLGGKLSRQQAQILEVLRVAIECDHETPSGSVGKTGKPASSVYQYAPPLFRFCAGG